MNVCVMSSYLNVQEDLVGQVVPVGQLVWKLHQRQTDLK